ncbi:hypothetical protein ABZP36_021496 [Zizania latifolia]
MQTGDPVVRALALSHDRALLPEGAERKLYNARFAAHFVLIHHCSIYKQQQLASSAAQQISSCSVVRILSGSTCNVTGSSAMAFIRGAVFASVALLLVVLASVAEGHRPELTERYYDKTCPNAQNIVRAVMKNRVAGNRRMAPAILRLFFHDCFANYPGVIHETVLGKHPDALIVEERYAAIKANVDELKPLQVGIFIHNARRQYVAWEFNLGDFNPVVDRHAICSLNYLDRRGLHVGTLHQYGIPVAVLTQGLASCNLVQRPELFWITYAGAYHVAYLIKVITGGAQLPSSITEFLATAQQLLGQNIYDVARMAAKFIDLPVGLEQIAKHLSIHPPTWSPALTGAGGTAVRALGVFMILLDFHLGGDVTAHKGLLQGLEPAGHRT